MARIILCVMGLNFLTFVNGSFPLPLTTPDSCNRNEYFDPVCVSCERCGGMSKDEQAKAQLLSADGSSCKCKSQYHLKEKKGPYSILCEKCPVKQVASLYGDGCVSCAENGFNETLGTCEPCNNGVIDERDGEQLCIPCAATNTTFDPKSNKCITCPKDFVAKNGECSCMNNKTLSGGHCLSVIENVPSLYTVIFENGEHVRSTFFVEHFQAARHNCRVKHNMTACQVLGNMCAMLQYRLNLLHEKSACSEFLEFTKDNRAQCHIHGKSFGLWLAYFGEDVESELYKRNVPFVYSSNPATPSSRLKFIALKYNLTGTLLQVSNIRSSDLELCQGYSSEDVAFIFGTRIEKKCQVPLKEIWDRSELIFYDLFLGNDLKINQSEMYPIPVLIRSVTRDGDQINKGTDMSKWLLVRRFFLTDHISGIGGSSQLMENHKQPIAKVFRYAADVSLKIILKKEGSPGSIYPPLLTISHAEASPDDYMKNIKVPVSFTVSYEMDQSETQRGIAIALGVLSILAFLWSSLQTWSWFRRSGKQAVDILTLGKFTIFMCGNLSTVFLLVMFCACFNWFALFKNQDVVHLLLPTPEQEKFLNVYLSIAFVMKAIHVIHMLAVQCTLDIFFIDWERPRIRASAAASRTITKSAPEDASAGGSNKSTSLSGNKMTPDKISTELPAVSIWRTYFVANEWAEIQSMRKISLSLQLFGTLFFLKVVGFENLALSGPAFKAAESGVLKDVPYSTSCRFALGAAVYLCIALAQVIVQKLFFERFVEDKLQQYVDLCSVSNVSVFMMITKRCGYYIHGRSTHGRADVNMKEMHELLRREEEDLCGHRGLLPNTEQQTFQMSLPPGVHDQFLRLLIPLTTYSQAADRMQGVGGRLAKVDIDRVIHTYQMLNKFLSGFVEHAFKDLDYIVKDKVLLENLLDIECYDMADRGYFYNDNGHSFDSVLLFGNESTLLVFDILLFIIIDIAFCDYVLAAVITFLIGKGIQTVRQSAGRRNLVRKALVDERFLT